eukprot:TRINITY_DN4064_c0_g1_i5.p1 TRINITY_DN4064_c0_g1~~TRINITY_DN4064_c0_g1_i5.p1  ORF type:complete len:304 (-),score=43.35 TRINITY_DN4064_c0_g1_i5:400-1311(-)
MILYQLISQLMMAISLGIFCLVLFHLKDRTPFPLLFVAYFLAGSAVGTFESNLLVSVGSQNKFWSILGIPIGVNMITIGGFLLLAQGVFCGWIFLGSLVAVLVGMFIFSIRIFPASVGSSNLTLRDLLFQVKNFRKWLPKIAIHSGALACCRVFGALFNPGVLLYIYSSQYINFTLYHRTLLKFYFFVIYNSTFFIGDMAGRQIMYNRKIVFPFLFLLFPLVGATMALLPWAEIAVISGFFIQLANGCIYAQSTRHIEAKVDPKYSLISFSVWLFLGDIGSIIGTNSIQWVAMGRRYLLARYF